MLVVGVGVMVGVLVVVPVDVRVRVWLEVRELKKVGDGKGVWVIKTTAVIEEVRVGVREASLILFGASSAATSPAQ